VKSELPHQGLQVTTRIADDPFGLGQQLEKVLLWKGTKEVSDDSDGSMPLRGTLFHVMRRGSIDDDPVTVEELFVSRGILPGIEQEDLARVPFLLMLQDRATRMIDRISQTVEGVRLKGADADFFGFREGHPAIRLHLVMEQAGGIPMAYMRLTGRIARCRIRTDYERTR
jgi:DNA-binding GntR family transcriptional regulator